MNRAVPNATDPAQVPPPSDTLVFHRALPGYAATPLVRAHELAGELGLADVFVKDESSRFGLPAFKFLGASWAIARAARRLERPRRAAPRGRRAGHPPSRHRHGRQPRPRGGADGELLGLAATIYVPAFTAQARRDAIAGEGADVVVVDDEYDAAVEASIRDADADPAAQAVNDADLTGESPSASG